MAAKMALLNATSLATIQRDTAFAHDAER